MHTTVARCVLIVSPREEKDSLHRRRVRRMRARSQVMVAMQQSLLEVNHTIPMTTNLLQPRIQSQELIPPTVINPLSLPTDRIPLNRKLPSFLLPRKPPSIVMMKKMMMIILLSTMLQPRGTPLSRDQPLLHRP